jgi:hypothetical protein
MLICEQFVYPNKISNIVKNGLWLTFINPRYLGGEDQKEHSLRLGKKLTRLHLNNKPNVGVYLPATQDKKVGGS